MTDPMRLNNRHNGTDQWRDARLKQCGLCGRQWPTERFELVERLISSERRARVAEQTLRDRMDHPEDRGLMLAYQARIQELEGIIERKNKQTMRGKNA